MLRKRFVSSLRASILLLLLSTPCLAGFWGTLKKVGRVATFPMTAPTETIINSGRVLAGQSGPSAILSPYRQVARNSGQLLADGTMLAAFPYEELNRRAQYFANLAGEPGAFVFDVTTFTNRFFNELAVSGGNSAGALLQQSNPLQVLATPLAAAIREARERHLRNARALPSNVRAALAPYFPEQVLDRAKYTIGKTDITLPNFIDMFHRFQGDDFAVTVDDIIVFNTDPGDFENNPIWWTHEMTHVEQYWRWGVESFAYTYLVDHGAVEAEADNKARDVVFSKMPADGGFGPSLLTRATVQGIVWPELPNRYYVAYDENGYLSSDFYIARVVLFGIPELVNYLVTKQGLVLAVDVRSGGSMQVGWAIPPRIRGAAWAIQASASVLDIMPNGQVLQWQPGSGYVSVGQVLNL